MRKIQHSPCQQLILMKMTILRYLHQQFPHQQDIFSQNTCKKTIHQITHTCNDKIHVGSVQRRRRGKGRGRTGVTRSSQRQSTIPWSSVNPESDAAPPQLTFTPADTPDLYLSPNPQPIDFFHCLFNAPVLQHLVEETNR